MDTIKQRLEMLVAAAAGEEHRRIRGGMELLQVGRGRASACRLCNILQPPS